MRYLVFILLTLPLPAYATVIFETTFDSNATWNSAREVQIYDGCSVIGASNSANVCPSGTYPTGFEAYRSVPVDGGTTFPPVVQINTLPGSAADHTGTGTGKAMVVYSESKTSGGVPWPGDGILVKYFGGSTYSELYVHFYVRMQPSWTWAANGSWGGTPDPTLKFWRVGYWKGLSAPQQNIFYIPDSHPGHFMDIVHKPAGDAVGVGYRCDPNDYYCTNVVGHNPYEANDYTYTTANFSDGNWHEFQYHIKMNTAGSYNGTLEMWQDGNLVYQRTDEAMWKESGSTAPGFTHVMFGGNSNNPFSSSGSQWYAIDDITISDTQIATGYIPGGATATDPGTTKIKASGKFSVK